MRKLLPALIVALSLCVPAYRYVHAAPEKKGSSAEAKAKPGKPPQKEGGKRKQEKPKTGKKNAAAVLTQMEKATAYTIKTAQAEGAAKKQGGKEGGALDPREKRQRPFWSGLKTVNKNVDALKKAIAAKDQNYFKLLDETGRAVAQVNDSARLIRVQNKGVIKGIKAMSVSYNELRRNFGKEAARKKKGGELSAKEKEQLAKLRGESKKLQAQLKAMHDKVEATRNARLLAELNDLLALSAEISNLRGDNLNAFVELMHLVDYFSDGWYSFGQNCQYWQPEIYTLWTSSNSEFQSYFSYYETSYTSWEYTEWSTMEQSIELVDTSVEYEIEIAESEYSAVDTSMESYSEESATEEMTAEEVAADEADMSAHDDDYYDATDDDDGDGLDDADDSDDDGDGVADDKDNDDDNDGVPDDDADGDGTADAQDDDDDNDGTPDAQDQDDDNDGVPDDEDDDSDNDGIDDDEDADDDNDGVADDDDTDDDGDGIDDSEDDDDGSDDDAEDDDGGDDDAGDDDGGDDGGDDGEDE